MSMRAGARRNFSDFRAWRKIKAVASISTRSTLDRAPCDDWPFARSRRSRLKSSFPLVLVSITALFGCGSSANGPSLSSGAGSTASGGAAAAPAIAQRAGRSPRAAAQQVAPLPLEPARVAPPRSDRAAPLAACPATRGPGFSPTNVTKSDARAAYDAWKTAHLEDCSGGVWRVRWENDRPDATVSEGVGYGLLLTVTYGDRSAFDGLVAYAKKMHDDNGLMHWLRYGCDAHRETKYSGSPRQLRVRCGSGFGDGAAHGQMQVGRRSIRRPGHTGDQRRTQEHVHGRERLHVLQPGDSSWFNDLGSGCINYSYLAPAYFRAFAKQVPSDADFWNKAADDTYELLAKASNPVTGLVRNWGSVNGVRPAVIASTPTNAPTRSVPTPPAPRGASRPITCGTRRQKPRPGATNSPNGSRPRT